LEFVLEEIRSEGHNLRKAIHEAFESVGAKLDAWAARIHEETLAFKREMRELGVDLDAADVKASEAEGAKPS
jgi:hypothetical protein